MSAASAGNFNSCIFRGRATRCIHVVLITRPGQPVRELALWVFQLPEASLAGRRGEDVVLVRHSGPPFVWSESFLISISILGAFFGVREPPFYVTRGTFENFSTGRLTLGPQSVQASGPRQPGPSSQRIGLELCQEEGPAAFRADLWFAYLGPTARPLPVPGRS